MEVVIGIAIWIAGMIVFTLVKKDIDTTSYGSPESGNGRTFISKGKSNE